MLVIGASLASMAVALAVLATWLKPDLVLAILLRGPRLGNDWFLEPIDEQQAKTGRQVLASLRVLMLVAVLAMAFVSGALVVWLRMGRAG
jgi:hypothetical protein